MSSILRRRCEVGLMFCAVSKIECRARQGKFCLANAFATRHEGIMNTHRANELKGQTPSKITRRTRLSRHQQYSSRRQTVVSIVGRHPSSSQQMRPASSILHAPAASQDRAWNLVHMLSRGVYVHRLICRRSHGNSSNYR